MSIMPPESPAHAKRDPSKWTGAQKFYASILVILGALITVIAFRVIYDTVTNLARPYMPAMPWSVVISCEIAFLFLFGLGILLAWRKVPSPAMRGLFMGLLITGSVILNVWAARGNTPDMAVHLVVVCAFFAVLLSGKSAFTMLRGSKVRADRIGGAEWLAHPLHSFRLQRWMATWGEPSRSVAHARYMRLLYAVAIAQADPAVGSGVGWRGHLPVTLRYQFSMGQLPEFPGDGWQEDVADHVRKLLHPEPKATPRAVSPPAPATASEATPASLAVTTPRPPASTAPVSAVKRVKKLGGRNASDDLVLAAMRELDAEATRPLSKTMVKESLPVGDARATRLMADWKKQQPVSISRAAAR